MKKIYWLLTIALVTITLSTNAQKKSKSKAKNDTPKDKIEINLDENSYVKGSAQVLSLDTNGVAVVFLKWNKESSGCLGLTPKYTADFVIEKYNKNLTKEYEFALGMENETYLKDMMVEDGKIYFWFAKANMKDFILVEFNTLTKKMSQIDCQFPVVVFPTQMMLKDGNIVIFNSSTISQGKQIGRACYSVMLLGVPLLFGSMNFPSWIYLGKVDLKKKKFEYTFIDEFGKKPHTYFLGANAGLPQNPGNIIIKDVVKKQSHIYSKTFKLQGSELKFGENAEIEMESKKEIYTAKVNNVNETEKLIYGNYGNKRQTRYGTSERSYRLKGDYFTKMDGKRLKWTQSFEYKKTIPKDQFVKYKRGGRFWVNLNYKGIYIRFLIQWPQIMGTELLMHDVIETENELIYIGESRSAKWLYEYRTSGSTTYLVKVFQGWTYNGFVVTSLDKTGKLLWTKCVKFPFSILTLSDTREFVNVYPDGDKLAFGFFNGTSVSTYFLDADNKFSSKPTTSKNAKISTDDTKKKTKNNISNSDCIKWTSDRYLVFGQTKLKNASNERRTKYSNGLRKSKYRNILYLSKVIIETEESK